MNWNIEYSRRANDFIEEHGIRDKIRESIKNFILRIVSRCGIMRMKGNLISLTSVIFILLVSMMLAGCVTTPLAKAASKGDTNEVRRLLDQGADVNLIDPNWISPLYAAALTGHTETVKLLIERGADVDSIHYNNWLSPLSAAALRGHTETVKLLIERGADVEQAIMQLGAFDTSNSRAGANMIIRLTKKQKTASQSISKEEIKTIKTDIDRPSFSPSQQVMGENDLAVIIGIESYQSLPKSDYSYDDAKLVGDYAKALGFKPRNIELLLDERATKSAIEKIIKTWLPNKAKAESRVFVYYSGHGAPEPKTGDAYLVPYDGDPNYLSDTGYPLRRLYDSLGKLQVAEVTVVFDTCFSGAGGRSVLAKGARPLVIMAERPILSQNVAVLSATQGTQISSSSPEKGHGIFTYYFLKALKDGKKNITEIYEYIKPLVEDEAKQSNVQQSPSVSPDAEKIKGRFGLRK